MQLALNVVNKMNIPDYEPDDFYEVIIQPECMHCKQQFGNTKLLAMHETEHMDIEIEEKIDNPRPWHASRPDANVRNKWLNYFDENGFEEDDVVIEAADQSLLIPVGTDRAIGDGKESPRVVLVETKPMVNGLPLGDYTKDERKAFYETMRVEGVNKKFCQLCRYTFKDNWAIEGHYFSSACHFTCKYCGMRFNKQRHIFDEHVQDHVTKGDPISDKIYATGKMNNMPRVIKPTKIGTQTPQTPQTPQQEEIKMQPVKVSSLLERKTLQPNLQTTPEFTFPQQGENEVKDVITSQSKTGNQAYFCRKCYKVFFKLEEFNVHSKNCDYNQFPSVRQSTRAYTHSKPQPPPNSMLLTPKSNGEVVTSSAGRPMRNCAKEIGPYKDEAYIPESVLKEKPQPTSQQSFVCFICNTPFPTIYSRNSHMRIHKGEVTANSPSTSQKHKPNNYVNNSVPKQTYRPHFVNVIEPQIKQEPLEPEVEIHESEQSYPSIGDGAVSITPISKNPQQRPTINPNVMRLVQNNPHLSIKKSPEKYSVPSGSQIPYMVNNSPDADKSYKCSNCWEAFANKSHLYFHKKNQCEGSRFPCPFCKKRFGTEAAYSSHIFYSHPE